MAHYVTSKGAIIALTRSLARELGPTRHPRQLHRAWPDLERRRGAATAHYDEAFVAGNTAAPFASSATAVPDDLVGTLVFLASTDSDFITGQTIVVDGGSVMH